MDNIIKRDESKLHTVPTKVISTMPIFIFVMLISVIVGIVFCVKKSYSVMCISFSIALICWAWGKFVDIYYNFQKNASIEFQDKQVLITYELDNNIYNVKDCTAKVTLKNITKIKKRGNFVTVYGDILKKQPRQNPKELKKYQIDLRGYNEYDMIINRLNEYHI